MERGVNKDRSCGENKEISKENLGMCQRERFHYRHKWTVILQHILLGIKCQSQLNSSPTYWPSRHESRGDEEEVMFISTQFSKWEIFNFISGADWNILFQQGDGTLEPTKWRSQQTYYQRTQNIRCMTGSPTEVICWDVLEYTGK